MNEQTFNRRIEYQKLKQTISWENIIVMIILFPTMFILIHWSFKNTPLPDYVKEIIITLIQFAVSPIIAMKSIGNHIWHKTKEQDVKDVKDARMANIKEQDVNINNK